MAPQSINFSIRLAETTNSKNKRIATPQPYLFEHA
jgi:hypothetical protein